MHESQSQNINGINSGDKGHHDLLQGNGYEIPDVVFDSLKANQSVLPYVPELPDITASSMLMKGLGSQYCSFMPPTMHRQKRLRESMPLFAGYSGRIKNEFTFDQFHNDVPDKIARPFGLSFPLEPDPSPKTPESFGVLQGSHTLSNGNFSASKPTSGAVKLELPSLQYTETDLGSWGTSSSPQPLLETVDAFIQSPPPTGTVDDSDCPSPRNSGLLDALLHEAKTLGCAKNHSSDKSSNSSSVTPADIADSCTLNICETEWEDYGDPLSPLGHSATSLFNECTPLSASGSSLEEQAPVETFVGKHHTFWSYK